jgi:glycerol-3-phosphate dehydrogenase
VKRDTAALAAQTWDVLVVGGGIYGAWALREAAQRGLRAALVEAGDFGGGTSWNSLKTAHGGLRHLQRGELALLRESVRERRALLHVAGELVRPLPFLVPTYGHGTRGREVLALGVLLNDLLSPDRNRELPPGSRLPGSRRLSRREVMARLPGIRGSGLSGGVCWHDAQLVSSERLLLAVLRAAADDGAVLANRVELVGLRRSDERICGAELRDLETGAVFEAKARVVLNAAGPGSERVWHLAGVERAPVPLLRGINLVFDLPPASEAAGSRRRDEPRLDGGGRSGAASSSTHPRKTDQPQEAKESLRPRGCDFVRR